MLCNGDAMRALVIFLSLMSATSGLLNAAEVRLVTLEYPPYTSEKLPDGGSMVELITRAFAATGNTVHIDFLPWARGQLELKHGKYAGLLPLWPEEVSAGLFIGSRPLAYSELGFFVRRDNLINFNDIKELRGRTVGGARGYAYPQRITDSGILIEEGASDLINLRKLGAKRFDLILLERQVGEYLLNLNPDLQRKIVWQGTVLERTPMSIGFAQPKVGQQENWPELFEQGMQKISNSGNATVK
jgi:polar amino acid transport system substrate-binding protein